MVEAVLGMNVSEREVEVLAAVARGMLTEAIAKALFVSTDTVKSHLRNASRKLGAHGRPHLIAVAYQQGLLRACHCEPGEAGAAVDELRREVDSWRPASVTFKAGTPPEYARGYRTGVRDAQKRVRQKTDQMGQAVPATRAGGDGHG